MKNQAVAAFLFLCLLSLVNSKSVPWHFYNSGGMGIINANGNIGNNNGNIGGGANSYISYGNIGNNNGNIAGGANSFVFYGNTGGTTGEKSEGLIKFGNVSWDGISFHNTGGIGIINHNGAIGNGIGNIGGGANSRIIIGNIGSDFGTIEGRNGSDISYEWEDFQRNLTRQILKDNEKWKNFSRDLRRNITRNIRKNNQKWNNFSRNLARNIHRNNQMWQNFSHNLTSQILKDSENFLNLGGMGVVRVNGPEK